MGGQVKRVSLWNTKSEFWILSWKFLLFKSSVLQCPHRKGFGLRMWRSVHAWPCTVGSEVRWARFRGRHVDSAADKNRITATQTAVQSCWWGRSDDKRFMAVWGRGNDMLLINSCARHRLFFDDNRRTALLFSFYMMPISDMGKICPFENLHTCHSGNKASCVSNKALHFN